MRIIAGDYKGRKLYTPEDKRVRPTADKVKEALFSMISGYLCDSVVIDLFSGTGNLGLEAISRGASFAFFGDNSKESLVLTRKNIEHCKAEDCAAVIPGDFEKVLARIAEDRRLGDGASVIFLDPPYRKGILETCIYQILERSVLSAEGAIVCEHGIDELLPDQLGDLVKLKGKRYGKIGVTIYGWQQDTE